MPGKGGAEPARPVMGLVRSSTSRVMTMAKTPSLNASVRPVPGRSDPASGCPAGGVFAGSVIRLGYLRGQRSRWARQLQARITVRGQGTGYGWPLPGAEGRVMNLAGKTVVLICACERQNCDTRPPSITAGQRAFSRIVPVTERYAVDWHHREDLPCRSSERSLAPSHGGTTAPTQARADLRVCAHSGSSGRAAAASARPAVTQSAA